MITPIIPPIVNLNGTSFDVLRDQYMAAYDAIRAARNAMQAATPHGRDYQSYQTMGMLSELARARHAEEATKLAQVEEYLEALLVKLLEQEHTHAMRVKLEGLK